MSDRIRSNVHKCRCGFCLNAPATTEIYTYLHNLSLHDALPISPARTAGAARRGKHCNGNRKPWGMTSPDVRADLRLHSSIPGNRSANTSICVNRSEEHTSELQSLMRISYAVFYLQNKNS